MFNQLLDRWLLLSTIILIAISTFAPTIVTIVASLKFFIILVVLVPIVFILIVTPIQRGI